MTGTEVPMLPEIGRAKGGCRVCGHPLRYTLVDLGAVPLCESWLTEEELHREETFYPLHAFVCESCFLVQVEEYVSGEEIFGGEYAYFSSYSTSWLEHCRRYSERIIERLGLDGDSFVVELASNDGYMLKNFVARAIPSLGIEPAANCAAAATAHSVESLVQFFDSDTARQVVESRGTADLIIANNVLAHVPALNDFVIGIKILLADDGVATAEFSHVVRQIEGNQFDAICQEHYCYFSLYSVEKLFAAHELEVFDVEEIPTHGGSLRIYVRHAGSGDAAASAALCDLRTREAAGRIDDLSSYRAFAERVTDTKRRLLEFLIEAKRDGKSIVGYGAPGKGTTLLNYCGVRSDFVDYLVDRNPYKHGRYMPGVRLPIFAPEKIDETRPDYILILPWNLKDEIMAQLAHVREWGARFVIPIPSVEVV